VEVAATELAAGWRGGSSSNRTSSNRTSNGGEGEVVAIELAMGGWGGTLKGCRCTEAEQGGGRAQRPETARALSTGMAREGSEDSGFFRSRLSKKKTQKLAFPFFLPRLA
jgi:hypothetical protein